MNIQQQHSPRESRIDINPFTDTIGFSAIISVSKMRQCDLHDEQPACIKINMPAVMCRERAARFAAALDYADQFAEGLDSGDNFTVYPPAQVHEITVELTL